MASAVCEDIPAPTEVSIFSAVNDGLWAVFTVVGNTTVTFVVYKDPLKKLRNPFIYCVVNLAIADLIVGLVYFPLGVYAHINEAYGELSEPVTVLLHMAFFISVTASILSLTALTIDRFLAIRFPLKHKLYLTWKRCTTIFGIIWAISLLIPFGYLKTGFVQCLVVNLFTSITLAFIVCAITYIQLYKYIYAQTTALAKQMKNSQSQSERMELRRLKQERTITRVFLIVLLVFLCTYGPAAVMILILKFCPNCNCYFRHWLRDFVLILVAFNSTMNPFVYTARLRTFRTSLGVLFKPFRMKRRSTIDNHEKETVSRKI